MTESNTQQQRRQIAEEIRHFIDSEGRVMRWPAKNQRVRRALLAYLVEQFEPGRFYSEKEVNALLWRSITFQDFVTLRRALCDTRLLERERDGSRYWRPVQQKEE